AGAQGAAGRHHGQRPFWCHDRAVTLLIVTQGLSMDFWVPDASSGEIVTASDLVAQVPLDAIAHWQVSRGKNRFPAGAAEILAQVGDNTLLVSVIDDGRDYEYRWVGSALVAGFGMDFSGQRLSEIEANVPRFGIGLRMLYEMVRSSAEPLCYR